MASPSLGLVQVLVLWGPIRPHNCEQPSLRDSGSVFATTLIAPTRVLYSTGPCILVLNMTPSKSGGDDASGTAHSMLSGEAPTLVVGRAIFEPRAAAREFKAKQISEAISGADFRGF